jgi:hypothetical protein
MRRVFGSAIAAFILLAFAVRQVEAQLPVAFVAGPTFSTISSSEFDDTGSKTGFFAAVGTSFPLTETVSFNPYVGYVKKGTTFDDGDSEESFDYIEIPLLLNVGFPLGETSSLGLSAGPAIGFQISCDEDGFDCSEYEDHKGTEFSFMGTAGVSFQTSPTGRFTVGAAYDLGLTNIYEDLDYKTRTIFLFLAYSTVVGG